MGLLDWLRVPAANAIEVPDGLSSRDFPRVLRDTRAQVRRYADDMGGALTTTGLFNAYVVNTGVGVDELRAGIKLLVRADRTNTGEATLNVDGLGPLPWVDAGGVRLLAGRIIAGRFYEVVLDPLAPAWRVQAGASTLTEIPGLLDLQADVSARAMAAAASAAATAADRAAVGIDRAATAASAAAAAASQFGAQAAQSAAEAARDQLLGTIVNVDRLTDLARQSAPKYITTPRAFVDYKGGAVANGSMGWRVPAGFTGEQALLRSYIDLTAGDLARNAGRQVLFIAELKTSIGFGTAFVGSGGPTDIRIGANPFGVANGSTAVLKVTDRADTYVLTMLAVLTGAETQIAIDLFVSGGARPVTADATVALNKTLWVPLDAAGPSEVVAAGDAATLVSAQAYSDLERARALTAEGVNTDLSRQSAPKNVTAPRAFATPQGGAVAIGATGWRVPVGQTGSGSLLRVYWDLSAGDVARNAGRPLQFVAELKTSLGFAAAFVGPLGPGDIRLGISPEAMPAGTTLALRLTPRADTYLLIMETVLTGTETQIAANILVAGGAVAQTSEASVNLNKTLWVPLDAAGTSEVVTAGDAVVKAFAQGLNDALSTTVATLPLSAPDMVALSTTRYAFDGGSRVDVCDRQLTIPIGKTGAGSLMISGLPFAGLIAGTRALFRFRFQVTADIGTSLEALATQVYIFGGTINLNDGSQIGAGGASLARVAPTVFDITVPRTVDSTEREIEVYLGVSGASSPRTTQGVIILRNAWTEVVGTSGSLTMSAQAQRCAESKVALLAGKPGFRNYLVAAADGSGDFLRIRDAVAAIGAGASATERNTVFVKPGEYLDECSTTTTINPPDYVDIVGLGRPEDVRIIARFPDNQANQDQIQVFFLMRTCRIANMTVIGKNIRYPFHIEGGNSQARAVQIFEDVIAIHEGATGWASPTAFGIGQHAGNHIVFRRCEGRSPTSALGFHGNVLWTRPASVLIEDCRLIATSADGQSLSLVTTGTGLMSWVCVRNTVLSGTVSHIRTMLPGCALSAHRANPFEYTLDFEGCSPVDWVSPCDAPALVLSSVAGPGSAAVVSGPGAAPLFGPAPDVRRGAADLAGRVISWHAVEVLPGEIDPGVTLAARLGDLRAAPLILYAAFDGLAPVSLTLDEDYRGRGNTDIVASLNVKLAAALGGNAGGRAFTLDKPYANRAPIRQGAREGIAVNADSASILKGMPLAWSGRAVRLWTSADTLDVFAGIAVTDAVTGERVRFQRTGTIGQVHLLFTGGQSFAIGDLFGVDTTPGRLAKGGAHALLRVRAITSYGAVFEITESRSDSAAIEIRPSDVTDVLVSKDWAVYGSIDFAPAGRSIKVDADFTFVHTDTASTMMSSRLRLVDLSTGAEVQASRPRTTIAEVGRQIGNGATVSYTGLTPGRTYRLLLEHYRSGTTGTTRIFEQVVTALCA